MVIFRGPPKKEKRILDVRLPPPERDDIEAVVHRTAVRVVRFLERRGVIAPAAAPADGELQVVGSDDLLAQGDALLGQLQAAACAGVPLIWQPGSTRSVCATTTQAQNLPWCLSGTRGPIGPPVRPCRPPSPWHAWFAPSDLGVSARLAG